VPQTVGRKWAHPETPGVQIQGFAHTTALGHRIGVRDARVQIVVTDIDAAISDLLQSLLLLLLLQLLLLLLLLLLMMLLSTAAIRADV